MVKPDDLVLEYLRAMRGDMAKMADAMRVMRVEMTSVRHHMIGISTLLDNDHLESLS